MGNLLDVNANLIIDAKILIAWPDVLYSYGGTIHELGLADLLVDLLLRVMLDVRWYDCTHENDCNQKLGPEFHSLGRSCLYTCYFNVLFFKYQNVKYIKCESIYLILLIYLILYKAKIDIDLSISSVYKRWWKSPRLQIYHAIHHQEGSCLYTKINLIEIELL